MASMGTYGMSVQMRRVRSSSDKLKRLQPRSDELELREKVMDQDVRRSSLNICHVPYETRIRFAP